MLPTLVGAVVEDVEGLFGRPPPLLVPEDEVDPLMQVGRHILRLLGQEGWSVKGLDPSPPIPDPWQAVSPPQVGSPPHQGLSVLLDEVLRGAGPWGQYHITHLLVGQLEAAQVKAWHREWVGCLHPVP